MIIMFYIALILMVLSYMVTTAGYWKLFVSEESGIIQKTRISLAVSLGLHCILLILLACLNRRLPFATAGEAILFCAWIVGGVHLVSEFVSTSKPLGIFTLLPTTLGVMLSVFMVQPPVSDLDVKYRGVLFSFHIVVSLTAYAGLIIAAILSVMYVLLFRKLKQKEFDVFFKRLPSLENLEQLAATWVIFGVTFMLLSAVLGRIWAREHSSDPGMSILETGIFGVMFLFMGTIAARTFFKFRGLRFTLAVIGCLVLLFLTHILQLHGFN